MNHFSGVGGHDEVVWLGMREFRLGEEGAERGDDDWLDEVWKWLSGRRWRPRCMADRQLAGGWTDESLVKDGVLKSPSGHIWQWPPPSIGSFL